MMLVISGVLVSSDLFSYSTTHFTRTYRV